MNLSSIFLFAVMIMVTYLIEGIIGFGGTILALPLITQVVSMKVAVNVLVIVVLFASLWAAVRDRAFIDFKVLRHILLYMIPGLPIGMWLFNVLPEKPLKISLGLFMIFVGAKGLLGYLMTKSNKKLVTKNTPPQKTSRLQHALLSFCLFLGGIIHGAFTCGGPFVVIYAKEKITNKTSFRATLCTLWALLNTLMLIISLCRHEITSEIWVLSGWTLPFMVAALYLANLLHHKIKAEVFTHIVNSALIISGILMIC